MAFEEVVLDTERGGVRCRMVAADPGDAGVVWVGGVGGGWDSPALGLYPELAETLARESGIASARVRFRHPMRLADCVYDMLEAARHLRGLGVARLGFVGHSLGGAVAIQAAARTPEARAAVALSTQAYGAEAAARLGPRCALLLVHGQRDWILSHRCSEQVHDIAREPKRLVLLPQAGHVLDEAADEVRREVTAWLRRWLAEPPTDAPSA